MAIDEDRWCAWRPWPFAIHQREGGVGLELLRLGKEKADERRGGKGRGEKVNSLKLVQMHVTEQQKVGTVV